VAEPQDDSEGIDGINSECERRTHGSTPVPNNAIKGLYVNTKGMDPANLAQIEKIAHDMGLPVRKFRGTKAFSQARASMQKIATGAKVFGGAGLAALGAMAPSRDKSTQ